MNQRVQKVSASCKSHPCPLKVIVFVAHLFNLIKNNVYKMKPVKKYVIRREVERGT